MKKINIGMFDQEILVFESREDFNRWESKNPVEGRDSRHEELDASAGMAGALFTEAGDSFWFIYLQDRSTRTLCHESLHIAYMMLDVLGIKHDISNHEVMAYLQEDIFAQSCKVLKIPVDF